jgi:hypothetical protein
MFRCVCNVLVTVLCGCNLDSLCCHYNDMLVIVTHKHSTEWAQNEMQFWMQSDTFHGFVEAVDAPASRHHPLVFGSPGEQAQDAH